jgi:hypothetical protein
MLKTAKFITNQTFVCGHCSSPLKVVEVKNNPRHIFNPGQLFSCECGKSQVWANSVRYMAELEKYCDGADKEELGAKWPESFGFCNDSFCGKCFDYLKVIKNAMPIFNGVPTTWPDLETQLPPDEMKRVLENREVEIFDVYGCNSCEDNQFLIHQGMDTEGKSGVGQKDIARWFRANQTMWRPGYGVLDKKACMSWYNEV